MSKRSPELICKKREYVKAKLLETQEFLTKEDEERILKIPENAWVAYFKDSGGDLRFLYEWEKADPKVTRQKRALRRQQKGGLRNETYTNPS